MTLKSFGCSFIFGSDLKDTNIVNPRSRKIYSRYSWPALLANTLEYKYECYAYPGVGNLMILESVLDQITVSTSSDFFVIGWTWIDRFDYYNHNYYAHDDAHPWLTIRPDKKTKQYEMYYKELHSDYRDKLTCLGYAKLVIDTLNQKSIPFLMTYMDELLFDCKHNTSSAVTVLQDYVKPYMTQFEGQTFLDWSRGKGYPEALNWHPLEEAHAAAAEYLIKVFDKKNTNAHCRLV